MMRCATVTIGMAMLAAMPVGAQNAATAGRPIESLGKVALRSPDGRRLTLRDLAQPGKPTLIAFWASWCIPCNLEAPALLALRRQYGRQYNFVYVNRRDGDPDPRQPVATMAQFIARVGLTGSDYVVSDVKGYRQIVGADLAAIPDGKVGIPRIYLFDRQGRQVYTALGYSPAKETELEQQLAAVIVRP